MQDCQRFDNWYLYRPDGNCYKQLRQGPCALGELFYLDPETAVTSCQCRSSWSKHFYPAHKKCYEHNSVGPCPAGQYFTFNETTGTTGCTCFTNFVADPQRQICVEKMTTGKFNRASIPLVHLFPISIQFQNSNSKTPTNEIIEIGKMLSNLGKPKRNPRDSLRISNGLQSTTIKIFCLIPSIQSTSI